MQYCVRVIPETYPYVLRPCAKCGAMKPFYPVNEVRINAQKKLLDVWLIHRCADCGQTWNLELFARVAPGKLDRALYDRMLANDQELVRQFAFDAELHGRKGVQLCLDGLKYRLEGDLPAIDELAGETELVIRCEVPLGVRVSKLLREALSVSGARLEALVAAGAVVSMDKLNLMKAKMGVECRVRIYL